MLREVFLFTIFALYFATIYSVSLGISIGNSEENQEKIILESLKEFVRTVEKYNLNVSIIGSHKKYRPNGEITASIIMHMPVNDVFLTEATLNADKQEKYLTKMEKIASKEKVGAKTRVIRFTDGEDNSVDEQAVNPEYFTDSPSYDSFAKYKNGKTILDDIIMENETITVLHNYIIGNVSDNGVKNVQIIAANVLITEKDVTDNFPVEVLDEIKQVLPRLYLSLDNTILARFLVEHLDKKFNGNFQALIGTDKFALGGKEYAYLDVGDINVVVFNLA